ncbi:MAG: pyridoxamine 5'-phosphate oxidase family protein [Actinomycetota bacterium]|nr:pyridoxamine 5'-phosphate oxidase family protein [Actinomycetota bacterium]
MDAADVLRVARELLGAVPYVLVCTARAQDVHARQVQLLETTDDLVLSFGTSPRSRKVADIHRTGRATIVAEVQERFAYVSISGVATVVDDETARRRLWIEELATFFTDGPLGDDFVIVRFHAERVEVMDFSEDVTPDPFGLVPAVLVRNGDGWETATPERRA